MKAATIFMAFLGMTALSGAHGYRVLTAPASSTCSGASLPAPISELLNTKFTGWRPKQVSDMEADDQQLWRKGAQENDCPGIAIGHFERTDSLSYALLLVPESDSSSGHKIVVFSTSNSKQAYNWTVLDRAEGATYSGLVISKAGPGKYEDWESRKSIHLKLDGIYVEWMEKGALVYYWAGGKYQKIQVSD